MSKQELGKNGYQHLVEECERLDIIRQDQFSKFEKVIITLSSGAFLLSVTFLKEIVEEPNQSSLIFLKLSWISLYISIVAILLSYLMSVKALDVEIDKKVKKYQSKSEAYNLKNNCWSCVVHISNWLSLITFLLGLLCMMIFAVHNL